MYNYLSLFYITALSLYLDSCSGNRSKSYFTLRLIGFIEQTVNLHVTGVDLC